MLSFNAALAAQYFNNAQGSFACVGQFLEKSLVLSEAAGAGFF